jgi:hypothetical protein
MYGHVGMASSTVRTVNCWRELIYQPLRDWWNSPKGPISFVP